VIITHGLIKKTAKTPVRDLERASKIMKRYLKFKSKSKMKKVTKEPKNRRQSRMQTVELDEITDKYIGKKGTSGRRHLSMSYDWIY